MGTARRWHESGRPLNNKRKAAMAKNNATLLFTLAVGTVLGVLIAPSSGRETRRRIMEKGSGAKDTLHYLLMEAGDLVDQLRSVMGNLSPSGSSNGHGTTAERQRQRGME
jgi:gas vesicle protein